MDAQHETATPDPSPTGPAQSRSAARFGIAIGIAVAAVGIWFAWLGWDTTYQYDEAGNAHGPYEAWQVIGGVASLIVLGTIAARWRSWAALIVIPLAFTAAWSWTAARADDSGLWAVGAIMVLIGTLGGAALLVFLVRLVGRLRSAGNESSV